jgi:hypothetical protein
MLVEARFACAFAAEMLLTTEKEAMLSFLPETLVASLPRVRPQPRCLVRGGNREASGFL